ncbi:hypothetical protein CDO44_04115 [Pigmentiphaga sp. NML080357]|uniref:hypothetical protein n=1 Tax=Pigmentiphaga sp. NML080357 TaxID=2008675 RepID=UPI000B408E25|nr:hypothetical protein [Pigmentiphaga sp. NML080357]OVZ62809.1 hypothetical protein CDO44_04115 [Pigmentiphaga sp. NML080357]
MTDKSVVFLLITVLALATCIAVFGMKYFSGARQARLRAAGEDAYRELAAKAVKAQEESAAALTALKQHTATIETRLAHVERVLKEVE